MLEIGKFFESALRDQSAELKKVALRELSKMGSDATLSELLASDLGQGVRHLSLRDLYETFAEVEVSTSSSEVLEPRRNPAASDQERIYLEILSHLGDGPQTIGQLAKSMDLEAAELRAYLDWMRSMGKVSTTGRARATRYHLSA
jgi:predicted Rossmann fold nucleotide-binding protein DprA/Smf involved in DNA uptake